MTESDSALTASDVADYLHRHPDFLRDYPQLAQLLVVPRADGNTTSLTSYQIEVLRDKNRELHRRLKELIDIAHDNEHLMVQVHALTMALVRSPDMASALRAVVAGLQEDFGTDLVRLCLFASTEDLPEMPAAEWLLFSDGVRDPSLEPFRAFLDRAEPLCGRLQPEKLDYLFGERASEVHSAVLLALNGQGMIALGSHDPAHFHPGMGTVFLKLLAEVISATLQVHRQRRRA